jgi:hypothetical protein
MTIPASDMQTEAFGTLFRRLNEGSGGGDTNVDFVSITTTNAVPTLLYSKTLTPNSGVTFRATILVTRGPNASVVGKFIREFTVKRFGSNPVALLQDLVPSLDYKEDPGLSLAPSVDVTNATIMVTGLSATLTWHGRIEFVS